MGRLTGERVWTDAAKNGEFATSTTGHAGVGLSGTDGPRMLGNAGGTSDGALARKVYRASL